MVIWQTTISDGIYWALHEAAKKYLRKDETEENAEIHIEQVTKDDLLEVLLEKEEKPEKRKSALGLMGYDSPGDIIGLPWE